MNSKTKKSNNKNNSPEITKTSQPHNDKGSAPTSKEESPIIANYDEFDYDYSDFWENRQYEHKAESFALKKLYNNLVGDWFVDIGGSYGRNVSIYRKKYHNCVLMDYSIQALKKASRNLKEQGITNISFVAANVYNLPFKEGSFDGGMMVRVIHHLEKPKKAFTELQRIFQQNGYFLLEFPNKHHLKALILAILRFDFKFILSKEPYLQPSKGVKEGASKDSMSIIYNFHPHFIRSVLRKNNFKLQKKRSVSFLRIPFLKKLLPLKVLMFLEKLLQFIFFWAPITPSILYLFQKKKDLSTKSHKNDQIQDSNKSSTVSVLDSSKPLANTFTDKICCPKCKSELIRNGTKLICKDCNLDFKIRGKIYDLRYPKPQQ
jgi:ubiquinone/menaquinone biosynthesis C-methylase UbiE